MDELLRSVEMILDPGRALAWSLGWAIMEATVFIELSVKKPWVEEKCAIFVLRFLLIERSEYALA